MTTFDKALIEAMKSKKIKIENLVVDSGGVVKLKIIMPTPEKETLNELLKQSVCLKIKS